MGNADIMWYYVENGLETVQNFQILCYTRAQISPFLSLHIFCVTVPKEYRARGLYFIDMAHNMSWFSCSQNFVEWHLCQIDTFGKSTTRDNDKKIQGVRKSSVALATIPIPANIPASYSHVQTREDSLVTGVQS